MSAVRSQDVLLRVGGRTLQRLQTLAAAGSGRGVEVPYTFSRADISPCATETDRDGVLHIAAANALRTEWVDLDGDGIRETPGFPLEGSRQNVLLRSEEFDNAVWSKANITVTPNAAFAPNGTATADEIKATASAATSMAQNGVITDTVCTYIIYAQKGTGATDANTFGLRNTTTATDLLFGTLNYDTAVWSYTVGSTGVTIERLPKAESSGNTWYKITIIVTSGITSGNTITAYGAFTGSVETANERCYLWGACLTPGINASYIKTVASAVTRAADSLTVPFNCGPQDLTILTRLARPVWANTNTGIVTGLYTLGTTPAALESYGWVAGPNFYSEIRGGANLSANLAIPAGAELRVCSQFTGFPGAAKTRLDVGSGFGSYSGTTTLAAFQNQTLTIGKSLSNAAELYGVLLDLIIVRGLFTLSEMSAIP